MQTPALSIFSASIFRFSPVTWLGSELTDTLISGDPPLHDPADVAIAEAPNPLHKATVASDGMQESRWTLVILHLSEPNHLHLSDP